LNPEIKKDPFSLQEDILILEKRITIGNKWSEIIKEMPGRTENNVKNRFNMMFKNIKDEFIKNRTHQSVFVMQKKVDQDPN
jgi:myb proto-oncogene protein